MNCLRLAAHALKGSVATVGSPAGRDLAANLERVGQAKTFDQAPQAYARLRMQLNLLEKEFKAAGLTEGSGSAPTRARKQKRAPARPARGKRGKDSHRRR
jgi:HPt (histidine-containing phosphotransfer) domain-containing protein